MVDKIHLWPEEVTQADGSAIAAVTTQGPSGDRTRLWYGVPIEHSPLLTRCADPFVVATIFRAMRESSDLIVHGEVSPSLLRNLEEFQQAWACWRPEQYTRIEVVADVEREQPRTGNSDEAIAAFSGGVDSAFTVFRHRTERCGRLRRHVRAGVAAHWSKEPTCRSNAEGGATRKLATMLASLGMTLIPVTTNFREIENAWRDVHGAAIASCLMLLQGGYGAGLIASTEPYNSLVLPYGSNPVTDRFMSSDAFEIVHDGAAFTRSDKIRELANWPEALRYLQVCWEGGQKDRNCGRCEKCIRTILNFRAVGLGLPECFAEDVSDSQILQLNDLNPPNHGWRHSISAYDETEHSKMLRTRPRTASGKASKRFPAHANSGS